MSKKIWQWLLVIAFVGVITLQLGQLISTPPPKEVTPVIPTGENCLALNYHRVTPKSFTKTALTFLTQSKELTTYDVSQETFAEQLDLLIASGAYFATPAELGQFRETGTYPDKCVWLSFDDVDQSVYQYAFPILQERQVPFTLFVISGHVGTNDFQNLQLATWDELRLMRDSGLATFGSHTHDLHYVLEDGAVFLQEQYIDDFSSDILESKLTIERELAVPVTTIAYPFGNTNETIIAAVAAIGYEQSFILSPHPITADANRFYQPRYLVSEQLFTESIIPWLAQP